MPASGEGTLDPTKLSINNAEVAMVFTIPLEDLLREDALIWHDLAHPGAPKPLRLPAFKIPSAQVASLPEEALERAFKPPGIPTDEVTIWGLTAFMLYNPFFRVMGLRT